MTSEYVAFKPHLVNVVQEDLERLKHRLEGNDFPLLDGKKFLDPQRIVLGEGPTSSKSVDVGLKRFKAESIEYFAANRYERFTESDSTQVPKSHGIDVSKVKGRRGVRVISLVVTPWQTSADKPIKTIPLFELSCEQPTDFRRLLHQPGADKWLEKLEACAVNSINSARAGGRMVACRPMLDTNIAGSFKANHENYLGWSGAWFKFGPPKDKRVSLGEFADQLRRCCSSFVQCFSDNRWFSIDVHTTHPDDLGSVTSKIVDVLCSNADDHIDSIKRRGYETTWPERDARMMSQLEESLRSHEQKLEAALDEVRQRSGMLSQVADNMQSHNSGLGSVFA